ncbi:1-aminocyclopropane-1-carboxylate deaminase/D-cysteine desulfhydrase [Arsenicibacter rosenii]|uniref:1-aminocyclopropane-1-carboxylate deaminase n=1 Tax=Arsenicibacter rosenii TaxID=1750698 RepID=A0A1S2VJG7_9BACT|nr:pyridoxal-phosphate dependent enzyme [Arsenicibacter rosenii]OIN58530.1 1-aminocyclopropane-1-carboxylate deaminase [Arsenicibacter rosenii]
MDELRQLPDHFSNDTPLERLHDPFPEPVPVRLYLKRDDLIHPQVSGNKWRKLKYNLAEAQRQGHTALLTFGGAFSNHLAATAAAGKLAGFRTIGIVRGDELRPDQNPTLRFCQSCGMRLHFVGREAYRQKEDESFIDGLRAAYGDFYLIPEGGTNALAMRGTAEIIPEITAQLGYAPEAVMSAVGTGGTVTGMALAALPQTRVLGVLALKSTGAFAMPAPSAAELLYEYHFGGYARTTPVLLDFIRAVESRTGILFEQVYTGKMLYALYDLARKGFFPPDATVVAVHTGGLQGRNF